MRISDAGLQELTEIYQDDFGESLSLANASEMAFRLISLYSLLTMALPSENKDEHNNVED